MNRVLAVWVISLFALTCAQQRARPLPNDLQRYHDHIRNKLKGADDELSRNFTSILLGLDGIHTQIIKMATTTAGRYFHQLEEFKREYTEGHNWSSEQARGSRCVDTLGHVLRRINDAERIIVQCVVKFIKTAEHHVDDVHKQEREVRHKLKNLGSRADACGSHYEGLPNENEAVKRCLDGIQNDGNHIYHETIPQIFEHHEKLEDFLHHPETNVEHCLKGVHIEYFSMHEREELHHQFQKCAGH